MGEQADLIINGDVCQVCGEEMGDGPGHPRTCTGCGGDDEGTVYDAMNRDRQERRASLEPGRMKYAADQLIKLQDELCGKITKVGISHDQIIVMMGEKQIDFWPFTGWFCGRKPLGKIKGRGIANLIKEIKCLLK